VNEAQAKDLAARLRRAAAAGAPIVELEGEEARDFFFISDAEKRPVLLGSFRIAPDAAPPFFASVVIGAGGPDNYQFFVIERMKGPPVLVTSGVSDKGLAWRYQPRKQSGDNEHRLHVFKQLAKDERILIPFPDDDFVGFVDALQRARQLRAAADSAGDDSNAALATLRSWFPDEEALRVVAQTIVASIRIAHELDPRSWCVTRTKARELIRLNVGIARVLDIGPGELGLEVSTERLGAATRARLRKRIDQDAGLSPERYGRNGLLSIPADGLALLDAEVLAAHRVIVERASQPTPHRRSHDPTTIEALQTLAGESVPSPAPADPNARTSFWKISPGEGGSDWARWRSERFIAIGWSELGDLAGVGEDEFDRRAAAARERHGWGPGVEQVWKFRNILPGDRIVANAGTTRVLGIGTVTGPYTYVAGESAAHRLPVEWDDDVPRHVEMGGWRKTLIRLTEETFERIQNAPESPAASSPPTAEPAGGIDFDGVLSHLESRTLAFPVELVASYLLALQAKRFVLLTGISGTGKTQLALEVARLLAPQAGAAAPTPPPGTVDIEVKPYMVRGGRIVVPADLAREFDALRDVGAKRLDVDLPGQLRASAAMYKDPERPSLLYVIASGTAKSWFTESLREGEHIRMSRAVDDDGAERLVIRKVDEERPAPVAATTSHALVAVRPDWTDARALLGFFNPLTGTYAGTPTLDLLQRARLEFDRASAEQRSARPFFLIFDEMNLARVEHYFSDFLSAMESGEPLQLHSDVALETADEGAVPRSIALPGNVFVVGTVNVDETTYMFSPKVLDRAFVLEFNAVDLALLEPGFVREDSRGAPLALTRMDEGLRLFGSDAPDDWALFGAIGGGAPRRLLGKIHDALRTEGRHFGYRVAREVARFVALAADQTDGSDVSVLAAFDVGVLAKVLPKLHGTQGELQPVLESLFAIAVGADDATAVSIATDDWKIVGEALTGPTRPPLPRCALKLLRMRRRLAVQGFVSFIE